MCWMMEEGRSRGEPLKRIRPRASSPRLNEISPTGWVKRYKELGINLPSLTLSSQRALYVSCAARVKQPRNIHHYSPLLAFEKRS